MGITRVAFPASDLDDSSSSCKRVLSHSSHQARLPRPGRTTQQVISRPRSPNPIVEIFPLDETIKIVDEATLELFRHSNCFKGGMVLEALGFPSVKGVRICVHLPNCLLLCCGLYERTQSHLTTAFLPSCGGGGGLRTGVSRSWNLEKRCNRFAVKCDAAVAEKETAEEGSGEKSENQAEVSRLLDLIVHSLYSHKPDPDNGTITITDTGIGMTKEELIDCNHCSEWHFQTWIVLGSENKDLGADNGLIGQFGVGFYSAFLVAEKREWTYTCLCFHVVVSTKSPKSDKQYVWESVADSSSYVIREETDPENFLRRGTQITLYLRVPFSIQPIKNLVKNYSQFVGFPIYTWQEKSRTIEVEEEEPSKEGEEEKEVEYCTKKTTKTEKYWDWELANETKPLWMRNSKEVSKEEYNEFYKKAFSQFLDPLAHTHFTTEGEVEFRSILYIPGMGPLNNEDVTNPITKNIRLHVKRVFISDDFDGELFPRYLSFVKGIVDSNDLPLNVSPEILQESRIVSAATASVIQEYHTFINNTHLDYKKFWENFGRFIKLGCIEDTVNHKRITPLLRFYSSKNEEELTSLDEYIENMGENQKAIYYLSWRS
ncbi:hypothetical protein Bca52824_054726 [Brassica carinata]|uniref:Uncharacterized protein n=1 Tax=Brassica carinata TaxID=52824 RepID=A0A8X7UPC5_BRACI|nr:hypothetical protein Bca52824_054726 [Brassica carinata]